MSRAGGPRVWLPRAAAWGWLLAVCALSACGGPGAKPLTSGEAGGDMVQASDDDLPCKPRGPC